MLRIILQNDWHISDLNFLFCILFGGIPVIHEQILLQYCWSSILEHCVKEKKDNKEMIFFTLK